MPGHAGRTRPQSLTLSPNSDPHLQAEDLLPQWASPHTSDTLSLSESEPDSSALAAVSALDSASISEEVFPLAADELGSLKPGERVTPQSPIVTPKSGDETLVPGTLSYTGRGGEGGGVG